nr:hypothetical protein [Prolixibacteraceae bacterium]
MKPYLLILFIILGVITHPIQAKKTNEKEPIRSININFLNEEGPLNAMFNECVGAGRANEGLRADWQQQLAYVKKECGFRYIRFHGLFTDD